MKQKQFAHIHYMDFGMLLYGNAISLMTNRNFNLLQ